MNISLTEDKKEWNQFVLNNSSDEFLQSWEWGDFQKSYGRKVWRFAIKDKGRTLAQALTICMRLPFGRSYVYIPRGPVWKRGRGEDSADMVWSLLTQNLRLIGLESNAFFVCIEPGFRRTLHNVTEREALQNFFRERHWNRGRQIQPRYITVVDLKKSEEQVLQAMHHKTRYNINLSKKKGLTLEQKNDKEGLTIFWEMLQETVRRDNISMYPFSYYRKIHNILYQKSIRTPIKIPIANLFLVRSIDGLPLSSAIMILFGTTAYYLYGASSNKKRNLMSNYFLQWEIMNWCREKGFTHYDMGGVAPPDAPATHPWSGITRFKQGFGSVMMQYPGTFFFPYNRIWYSAYISGKWLKRLFN